MEMSLELSGERADLKSELIADLQQMLNDIKELPVFPQGSSKHYAVLSKKETIEEIINLIKKK
jgi:hypothetical protein